ncbi:FAST kinase domain-containing protein 4 isoform X1 [Aquila chrysaetos chrysaetos]|uniref:FAST kinase domain-containing protein 4 isoform X1 n=1 Tax=Aquila chrysaetos chrysaetos TaxID=223781 RepID=UPI001B7D45CB|nr:FAST kinase domain-containing protein 4 isoform X1 [Aquila chrysaetos chrysaetos]XP_040978596.1 FAST kinase domain-containing protein 4 isoform X1 [Aquila chrysaetos chrysaetos]XP_040978597.1 FAST kinase domain-containing protein 4 isoform X1 [Aquila chrysaetos chrysaetos]XP_040978598.1 FAST kinase domain-containing protein 4 isoform X1 [Aquila chrysaetos chrysaetos]
MAAHLVRRCCWRHFGAFIAAPSAVPASLLVPAGKVAMARALPQAPLASFHTSSPSSWADGFSVKEQVEDSGNPEHKVIRELIETATSPQELFQLTKHHALNSNEASLIIIQLSRLAALKNLETESILQDECFQQVISIMDSQISQVWNNTLLNLLKSLYSLGVDSNKREMQSVEQEVLWRLRRLTFRQLASLAEFFAAKQVKESRLLNEVIKKLELRWTELEGTRTVVALISKVGHISPALMDRLEDKALELAEQFNPDDIRKISLALAYQNRRCVPLLRALSYHLIQKHSELSLNVLLDLIFAYGKLNFHQPQVFQKIATDLHPHVSTMTPVEVTRCIRSFSLLKWLNLPLFEAIAQYALDNTKQLSVTHLCSIILSFARLNFQPSGIEDFFNMVHEVLQGQLDSLEPHLLTDLVWSLCVLQQAKAPYLQRVLAPAFHAQIRGDQSFKAQNLRLRLININAAARLESPSYQGPFLPVEMLSATQPVGEKVTLLQSSLREALSGVLGSQDNGRFNVHTIYGWQIASRPSACSSQLPCLVPISSRNLTLKAEQKPQPRAWLWVADAGGKPFCSQAAQRPVKGFWLCPPFPCRTPGSHSPPQAPPAPCSPAALSNSVPASSVAGTGQPAATATSVVCWPHVPFLWDTGG